MLKFLVLSYSELLLITTHCSWIVNIYIYILTNSHFSLLFPLSLLSLDGCVPAMVVCRGLWSDGCGSWSDGSMVMVRLLGHGAVFLGRGSWLLNVLPLTKLKTRS